MLWNAESSVVYNQSLHDGAVFVVVPSLLIRTVAFLDLRPIPRRRNFHRCSATRCCSNRCYSMLCPFITSFRGPHIPHIGFQWIPSGADSHLCEIPYCVFCLGKTFNTLVKTMKFNQRDNFAIPHSAAWRAHSYASFSSFSRTGSAPTIYQAHSAIIAAGCPLCAAPV